MEGFENYGILGTFFAILYIFLRVGEKGLDLLLTLVKARQIGKLEGNEEKKRLPSGHNTADIAVQREHIRQLVQDVDWVRSSVIEIQGSTEKDLPHVLDKILDRIETLTEMQREGAGVQREALDDLTQEMKVLRQALEINTRAYETLHSLLSRALKP